MGATRRKFSRGFKLEAVRQLEAGRRLAEVARDLRVVQKALDYLVAEGTVIKRKTVGGDTVYVMRGT